MELIKGVNPSDVLPYLEVAVTNTLVKSLYRNCNKRVLQHQVVQRQLGSSVKLAGISSYPPDIDISSLQGKLRRFHEVKMIPWSIKLTALLSIL